MRPSLPRSAAALPRLVTLALTLALAPLVCGADQIYRSTGAFDRPIFTDKPTPGAKKVGPTKPAQAKPAAGTVATDPPEIEQGLWELSRTISRDGAPGQAMFATKCIDPLATMTFWQADPSRPQCTYEPTKRSGNTYTQASQCTASGGSRSAIGTLTVDGRHAYVLEESITGGGEPSLASTTRARRVGDCGGPPKT